MKNDLVSELRSFSKYAKFSNNKVKSPKFVGYGLCVEERRVGD